MAQATNKDKVEQAVTIQSAELNLNDAESRRKKLTQVYKNEPKRSVYLSPMYRPYVGNVMRVMINGISIFFPVDGSAHEVPATFADEIEARRKAIDAILLKKNLMADIASNVEYNPGDLALV